MSEYMRNSGGGFSGSHRAAQKRSSANRAAAAELNRAMQAAKRAAHPINQPGAMARAMENAMLGRRGAFGVPGRAPRIPGKLLGRMVPGLNLISLLQDFSDIGFEWMQTQEGVPEGFSPGSTWIRCSTPSQTCENTWSPPTHYRFLSTDGTACTTHAACAVAQSYPGNATSRAAASPVPAGWNRIRFYTQTGGPDVFGNLSGTIMSQWRRPVVTGEVPSPWVDEVPAIVGPIPVSQPSPQPETRFEFSKKPATRWLPKFGPQVEPWVGGDTGGGGASGDWGADPNPSPDLDVEPDVDVDDDLKPYERPAVNIPMTPDGPDKPTIVVHRDLPPPRHIKEVKWKLPRSKLGDFYGALTEIKDFLEAANAAIPDSPCGSGGLHTRFACVVKNAHKIDPVIFMKEAARMQLEDYTIGKANQLANQITKSPYWQRPVGQGFGSFSHRMR